MREDLIDTTPSDRQMPSENHTKSTSIQNEGTKNTIQAISVKSQHSQNQSHRSNQYVFESHNSKP